MTQHELVLAWIKEHGSILPAKMSGIVYLGEMFGSETSKRCRELRKKGKLRGEKDGRFERFFLEEQKEFPPQQIFRPEVLERMNNKQGHLI